MMKELQIIQSKLNAPKGQFNSYGNYHYRSCEDILEALKPLLKETGCSICLWDEVVQLGERYYVKAIVTLTNSDGEKVTSQALAREQTEVKGQIAAQITGATSSYARKYALNGLFAIDDNKDPDATNTHGKEPSNDKKPEKKENKSVEKPQDDSPFPAKDAVREKAIKLAKEASTPEEVTKVWKEYKGKYSNDTEFVAAIKNNPNNPNKKK